MDLATAQRYAAKISTWLIPHTERLFITGSIRRDRISPADIDICCIAKSTVYRDMFQVETGRQNHLWMFLRSYVDNFDQRTLKPGQAKPEITSGFDHPGKRMTLTLPSCQLDIWFADETNWANKLLNSTGSAEHNIWIADRATARGLHWYVSEGLAKIADLRAHKLLDHPHAPREARKLGLILPSPDETAFYAHLGLQFIDPKNRELPWLLKNIDSGL